MRHCGPVLHPVRSAERLRPVQDAAAQGICLVIGSDTAIGRPEVPSDMRLSDRRIFEPLGGRFELPIERVRWKQPVERACYRQQRAA